MGAPLMILAGAAYVLDALDVYDYVSSLWEDEPVPKPPVVQRIQQRVAVNVDGLRVDIAKLRAAADALFSPDQRVRHPGFCDAGHSASQEEAQWAAILEVAHSFNQLLELLGTRDPRVESIQSVAQSAPKTSWKSQVVKGVRKYAPIVIKELTK